MKRRSAARASMIALAVLAAVPHAASAKPKLRVEVEGLGGALGGVVQNFNLKGSDLRQNVLSALSIESASEEDGQTEGRIRQLHKKAPDEIRRALQPFGYYKPSIEATLDREGDTWEARYQIDPGPLLHVSSIDLGVHGAGSDDRALQSAVSAFPLKRGDPVVSPAYERGKTAIEEAALENGYLKAGFRRSEIRVDLQKYTADVVIDYDTGPRYRFGPTRFDQDFLDDRVIRGYVTWNVGDPLSVPKILEFQNALSDAPYFRRVEVVPQLEEATGLEVPIEVNLVAARPRRHEFGIGYGTETGPRASIVTLFRRLNRAGHRADATIHVSGIEKSVAARYLIPGPYPRTDVYTFSLGYAHLTPTSSDTRSFMAGADRSQKRNGWRESFSLFYRRESFEVGSDEGTSHLLVPGSSWEHVVADDRLDTRKGYRLRFLLQAAREGILSNATFARADAGAKVILPLGDSSRIIGRADAGYMATGDFNRLPPRYRYFAGGDQSVRGYAYQALGPLDSEGRVIGGTVLGVASLEYEYRFLPKWGAAVFGDAGNAFDRFSGSLKKGAGVGARWISPVGPIRVDVGYGFDAPGPGFKLHISIGPDL
ncbi:MAG: autotransporter assembly complex family protein [Acidobacteriota bacterium]